MPTQRNMRVQHVAMGVGRRGVQVRTLSETVRLDARTKLLNPKWYEGMLASGYEGVREIQKRLTNTMGWSATSGTVDNWIYDDANSTFIEVRLRVCDLWFRVSGVKACLCAISFIARTAP